LAKAIAPKAHLYLNLRGVSRQLCGVTGSLKMSKFLKLLDRLRKDEQGASMAEYVVLLGVITAGVIAVVTAFAGQITAKFNAVCNTLTGGTGGC
jgi:Flp pilus assembly pilin Flp